MLNCIILQGDLVRLTVLTKVEVVTSWVRVLAVVITVERVSSFVTVEVNAFVDVVNFLVDEEVNSFVVYLSC